MDGFFIEDDELLEKRIMVTKIKAVIVLTLKRLGNQFEPPPSPPHCGFFKNIFSRERVKPGFL